MCFTDMYISILHFTGTKYCVKILTGAKMVSNKYNLSKAL